MKEHKKTSNILNVKRFMDFGDDSPPCNCQKQFQALILCGFFCAGKSTIGKLAAEELSLPFYDTDRLIEIHYNKHVGQIWQELGTEAFRDLETEVIFSLKKEACVLATGGGSLLREENRRYLKELGISVYLKASISVLYQRVLQRGYPAYLKCSDPYAHFEAIAKERFPIYENHCRYMIESDTLTAHEVWAAIVLGRFSGSPLGESHTVKR